MQPVCNSHHRGAALGMTTIKVLALAICLSAAALARGQDSLLVDLNGLDALRKGHDTPYEKVEKQGARLLEKYKDGKAQGRIYYQLAHVYAQTGLDRPQPAIAHAKKALEFPLELDLELRLYCYWGDAVQVAGRSEALSGPRRQAAAIYLAGLKKVLALKLPDKIDEPTDVPVISDDPATQRKMAERAKRVEKARWHETMLRHRDVLTGQLVRLYSRKPYARGELEELVRASLKDAKQVEQLVEAVEIEIYNTPDPSDEGRPAGKLVLVEGPPATFGDMKHETVSELPPRDRLEIGIGESVRMWIEPSEFEDIDYLVEGETKTKVKDAMGLVIWMATGEAEMYPIVGPRSMLTALLSDHAGELSIQVSVFDSSSRSPKPAAVQSL